MSLAIAVRDGYYYPQVYPASAVSREQPPRAAPE